MRLVDDMVVMFLIFSGISILFFIVTLPIYIPTSKAQGYLFSTSLPIHIICRILMTATLTGVRWFLTVVLTYIPLMINDAEKLFMYLFAICIFGKMSVRSFCSVSIRLFVCFLYCIVWAFYRFWILTPYQTYHLQIFPPIQRVVFSFCWWFPLMCKSF